MSADAKLWRALRADFEGLQPSDFSLAWVSVPLSPEAESLEIQWCWLRFPDDSLRARLSALALRGAKALGYNSEYAWYDELRRANFVAKFPGCGLKERSDSTIVESESGRIEDVLKESITLCNKLEALETSVEVRSSVAGSQDLELTPDEAIPPRPASATPGQPEGAPPPAHCVEAEPSPMEDAHVALLKIVLKTGPITLEKWTAWHKLGRTTVFDWKAARLAGKSLKGKVSDLKSAASEQAIADDARHSDPLGLARTSSDSSE